MKVFSSLGKLILKLLNSLVRVTLLAAIILLFLSWMNLPDERKRELLISLEEKTPFSIFGMSESFKSKLRSGIHESDSELIKESARFISEGLSQSPGGQNLLHIFDPDCGLPDTKEKQQEAQSKIYQWRDANGKLHFSDSPVSKTEQDGEAEDISSKYQSRDSYISTKVLPIKAPLPLSFETKINTAIKKMFLVLSEAFHTRQLSQLELQLKIFGDKQEFQDYARTKDSLLIDAAGFYLPKENEASVLLQAGDQQTFSLVQHEASHVLMANLYGLSPIWLNEGFAEYFQNMKISGFETTVYPSAYHFRAVKAVLNGNEDYSLRTHFELTPFEWQGKDIQLHYSEAWSIVFFLLSSNEGKFVLTKYFEVLAEERCSVPNSANFFENNYPGGIRQMDKDWKRWLSQREVHPHRY
jgi:hypothetical protein